MKCHALIIRIWRLDWIHTMGVMVAGVKSVIGHGKSGVGRKLAAAAPFLAINLHGLRLGATRCFLARSINLHGGPEKIVPALVKRTAGNLRQTESMLQPLRLLGIFP